MAKLLNQLPLFSLVHFDRDLYKQMMKEVRRKFPSLIKKIRKISAEDVREAVHGSDVTFRESLRYPTMVAVTMNILEVFQTELFTAVTLEIMFPLGGKPWKVKKITHKILGLDEPQNDEDNGRGGITISIIMGRDDAPILIFGRGKNGSRKNGSSQDLSREFWIARKES